MTRALGLLPAATAILLTVSAVPAPANETPSAAKSAEPTKQQSTVYRRALKEGRSKAAAGDQAGAVAAFREALAAVPDDPAALSELGLAALHQKDYKTAEQATRQAIARIGEPALDDKARLRAASLYNLGLILEERGDRLPAIEAYVASLKTNPNQTVSERLIGLDAQTAAAEDPLAPKPMDGPFASIEEFCAKVTQPACRPRNPSRSKVECHKRPESAAAKVTAPFLAVRIYSTICEDGDSIGSLDYHLAVLTQAGWWFAPERFRAMVNPSHYHEQRTFPELGVNELIPGSPPVVLVRSKSNGSYFNAGHYYESSWEDEEWVVVSIGPSGKPSATPPIVLKMKFSETTRTVDDDRGKTSEARANLKINFQQGGQAAIHGEMIGEARGLAYEKPERAKLLGKHLIIFP